MEYCPEWSEKINFSEYDTLEETKCKIVKIIGFFNIVSK